MSKHEAICGCITAIALFIALSVCDIMSDKYEAQKAQAIAGQCQCQEVKP